MSSEQITQETVPVETTTTETVQPTAQPTTVANADTPISSWKDSISEEYRVDPNIEKFTEIDALAKSYINATKMIGQDKVEIPNNNSTEDQRNEVYVKLGRPEYDDKNLLHRAWQSRYDDRLFTSEKRADRVNPPPSNIWVKHTFIKSKVKAHQYTFHSSVQDDWGNY